MKMFDFSDKRRCYSFQYQKRYYEICCSIRNDRWYIVGHNSILEAARPHLRTVPVKCLGKLFKTPEELIRTVTIDGRTVEDIILDLPDYQPQVYDYNYDRFLLDMARPVTEYEFIFRERHFFIVYSRKNIDGCVPCWTFGEMPEGELIRVNSNDHSEKLEEFILQVDPWMLDRVGMSLKEMFNTCYKEDQTGELRFDSVYMY
jgi:hypothetical protein